MNTHSGDIYPLLPSLWHRLLPTEKRLVVAIVKRSNLGYSAKCLHELHFEAHVIYPDMQKLRLCAEAARENPGHFDLDMPEESPTGNVAPGLAAAVAAQLPVTCGLATSSRTWLRFGPATAARRDLPSSWTWR